MSIAKFMTRSVLFGALACAVAAPANAGSITFDLNLSAASGGAHADVLGVAELITTAGTVLGYRDAPGGGAGVISPGDTFTAYSVIRVVSFNDADGNPIPVPGYGASHEITITAVYNGVQLTANAYAVTSISALDVRYDSGAGFTASSFNNLTTFFDGTVVETGTLGGPSSGTNTVPTNPTGAISIVAALTDLLHLGRTGEYFELDPLTGAGLDSNTLQSLVGIFDATPSTVPPANFAGGLNGGTTIRQPPGSGAGANKVIAVGGGYADVFAAYGLGGTQAVAPTFGGAITSLHDSNGAFSFAFSLRSDGSFVKETSIVPEPGSLIVWSLVACGFGVYTVRRRK